MVCVGHRGLFGRGVSKNEIATIIGRYPTSQWLDLAAKIDGLISFENQNFGPRYRYAVERLFPPSVRQRLSRSPDDTVFSTEQLLLLRAFAIAYGGDWTRGINVEIPISDISRVLLGLTDYMGRLSDMNGEEQVQRFVARSWFINNQDCCFNSFFRTRFLFIQGDSNAHGVDYRDEFMRLTGLSTQEAIALGWGLLTPFCGDAFTVLYRTSIIIEDSFFALLRFDQNMARGLLASVTVDISSLKSQMLDMIAADDGSLVGKISEILRKTPLIALGNGELVVGSLSGLFAKFNDNLLWLPVTGLVGEERQRYVHGMTDYRGKRFEEYLKYLCGEMARLNPRLSYAYISPEATADHEEVGDSLLAEDNNLLVFEAKSRQLVGQSRVGGDIFDDSHFVDEMCVKAARQLQTAAMKVVDGSVNHMVIPVARRVFPVVVTFDQLPYHFGLQRRMRDIIRQNELLTDQLFAPIEYVSIDTLEQLMNMADSRTVVSILASKNEEGEEASSASLNNYVASQLESVSAEGRPIISNGWCCDRRAEALASWRGDVSFV
jgi:hypothetical protein